jgi:hypothetical protein
LEYRALNEYHPHREKTSKDEDDNLSVSEKGGNDADEEMGLKDHHDLEEDS